MDYTFQFGVVAEHIPYLIGGAWLSLLLAFLAFWAGAVIGLLGAMGKTFGDRVLYRVIDVYVVFFTNTPALVQIYVIFYGLPDLGIVLSPFNSVLLGLTLNCGAYLTEIQRAGFQSVRREELEAAETLGHVLVADGALRHRPPHRRRLSTPRCPTSTSGSCSEARWPASSRWKSSPAGRLNVSSTTFRTIEVFTYTAGIYVVLTVVASALLALIGRHAFRVKARIF